MKFNIPEHYDLEKLKAFLGTKGKKVLVFDRDADGVCSAVLLSKKFSGFRVVAKRVPKMPADFLEDMISKKAALYVFLDMAADHGWKSLEKLGSAVPEARFVIIDHHPPEKDMNSEKFIHINPSFFMNAYIPTSYLVYRIMEHYDSGIRKFAWVASIGCIADYAFRDVDDIYREAEKLYPGLIGKDPKRSKLSKGMEMVEAMITLGEEKGALEAYRKMKTIGTFQGVAKDGSFSEALRKVKDEYSKVLAKAKKNMELHKDLKLAVVKLDTEYRFTSSVSTYFSEKYPDHVIVVGRQSEDGWGISLRNNSGTTDVSRIAKECTKGIGTGGGHSVASGANVNDWDKFRERVIAWVGKHHPSP